MTQIHIYFIITILIVFILLIILFLLFTDNNININNKKNNNDILIDYNNIVWNFDVGTNNKLLQEKLAILSKFNLELILNKQNINYSIVETLLKNYDKLTDNWYTKNITVPKYFLLSLWENQNYVFKDKKNININIISLLDKIFNSEQNINDDLIYGYDVILYNLIYIKLQEKYNLKTYNCHKNKTYMDKINNILEKDFKINNKWSGNGFYNDNSFIYKNNVPYNIGYLKDLIQDIYYIDKYKLHNYNTNNKKILIKYIQPFIYGNYINYNGLGIKITKNNITKDIYQTLIYLNEIFNNILINDSNYFYKKTYISNKFINENKKYLMPIIGTYVWYGKNYDNYIINGYNNFTKPDINTTDYNADLLIKNSNYYSNILFGDENLIEWYQNINLVNSQLILSGCLVDEDDKIINTQGWLTNVYKEISKNIDIVIYFTNNLETKILMYYIIDKNLKIVTWCIKFNKITTYKVYPVSIYQNNTNITYNKSGNTISIISFMKPRYIITDLPNQDIDLASDFSNNNYCRVKYDLNNKDNLIYLSTNPDYKLPVVNIENNVLKYNDIFTIENNINTIKDYEKFEMLCITTNNDKIYVYPVYPYDNKNPVPSNFIVDSEYRCYKN